jgi:hypothetical protein
MDDASDNSELKPGLSLYDLGWRPYYAMLGRWLHRMHAVKEERCCLGEKASHLDCIFAFFQTCYHFRDWLQESGEVPQADIETLFSTSLELQVCRDFCLAAKHMRIRNKKSADPDFYLFREWDHFHVPRPDDGPDAPCLLRLRAKEHTFDLFELADRCQFIWQQFLCRRGLIKVDSGTQTLTRGLS